MRRAPLLVLLATIAPLASLAAQQSALQTDADHYTRYELQAPGTARFRILYEVTATTPGATRYFNVIRQGSVATDEAVYDRSTGAALRWDVVDGTVARAGGVRSATAGTSYIMVSLPRPVPADGELRLLIDKTYEDAASYIAGGDTLVFTRSLGIKRNAVVLPAGYEVTSVNYPSQVKREADGRIALSFMNIGAAAVPYVVRGRRERRVEVPTSPSSQAELAAVLRDSRLGERAHQDREIVYSLQQPETNSFDLYHDYTESRPGVDRYLNIVRGGSTVSRPSARVLDTGAELPTRILRGEEITQAGIEIGQGVTRESEVVVIPFAPVKAGESVRLRISETYTDPARYRLVDGTLVWDRAFGRPANAMILPAGWLLSNCSVPATVSLTADGRVRLDFLNPRTDDISVLLTAVRRR